MIHVFDAAATFHARDHVRCGENLLAIRIHRESLPGGGNGPSQTVLNETSKFLSKRFHETSADGYRRPNAGITQSL